MNIGDIVIDLTGKKWIIYDVLWRTGQYLMCVTDFETQKLNEALFPDQVQSVESKPTNVQWMFILKRERNLKLLEKML